MAESTNPSCFSCRWVPAPLWLQGAEGLGCCPALAEGSWDFFSPHLLSVSHRHIGPIAFKLPFATGTLENCVLGLVGVRRLSGRCSSCGPGPALPGWVLRATGLTDHLVQLPQQGQVSSAGSDCWPPRVTDGTHVTFCRTLPSLCVFSTSKPPGAREHACLTSAFVLHGHAACHVLPKGDTVVHSPHPATHLTTSLPPPQAIDRATDQVALPCREII